MQTQVLPNFKNSDIFRVIREKKVKINGKKTDPSYILQANDEIKIFLPNNVFGEPKAQPKFRSVKTNLDILSEDQNLIVINKKQGVPVHSTQNDYKDNLTESVRAYLYNAGRYCTSDMFAPSPCHRLDTNTTGVIIFAKNQHTLNAVNEIFRKRTCTKTYIGLAYGIIGQTVIVSDIDASPNKQNKVTISNLTTMSSVVQNPDDNRCITAIEPIKKIDEATLIKINLLTGKKHQIRAHLQAIGHPLLGDQKYFTARSKAFSQKHGINTYLLHCRSIVLPEYGTFQAPMPAEFDTVINALAQNNNQARPTK